LKEKIQQVKMEFGEKVKGKYTPLMTSQGIEEIRIISLLESTKPHLPYLFIETEKNYYIGLTLARNTSDLLVLIAKNELRKIKSKEVSTPFYLIQYMLPADFSSNKLIVLAPLSESVDVHQLKTHLQTLQHVFLMKLNQLADSINSL
jgi:hypothetical protein